MKNIEYITKYGKGKDAKYTIKIKGEDDKAISRSTYYYYRKHKENFIIPTLRRA